MSFLYSSNLNDIKLKLISKISHVVVKKHIVKIYVSDKAFLKDVQDSKNLKFVKNCQDADVILCSIVGKLSKRCKNKIVFTTKYRSYKNSKFVFGAIFWQKGRPNLIFRASCLKKRGIKLPKSYKKYIDK